MSDDAIVLRQPSSHALARVAGPEDGSPANRRSQAPTDPPTDPPAEAFGRGDATVAEAFGRGDEPTKPHPDQTHPNGKHGNGSPDGNGEARHQQGDNQDQQPPKPPAIEPAQTWKIVALGIGAVVLFIVLLLVGLIPRMMNQHRLVADARQQAQAKPRVTTIRPVRSEPATQVHLFGNIMAYRETDVFARTNGFVGVLKADIGEKVKAGEVLAEIETPDLDQQVVQAQAGLVSAQTQVPKSQADLDLARVTLKRYQVVLPTGGVTQQEIDQYEDQVHDAEQALSSAQAAVAQQQANLKGLQALENYKHLTAPFDGVVTVRNIDVGSNVVSGGSVTSGAMFHLAEYDILRVFVQVPQQYVAGIKPGQAASLSVVAFPGREFTGKVARIADAVDAASRTMNVEVDVPNEKGTLFPGMSATVTIRVPRVDRPLVVPASAFIQVPEGEQVAVVEHQDNKDIVHFRTITVGQDYGNQIEVVGGLSENDEVVSNQPTTLQDGAEVEVTPPQNPMRNDPNGAADTSGTGSAGNSGAAGNTGGNSRTSGS